MATWFLPPDFTFVESRLPLGAIIRSPENPSDVIAMLETEPSVKDSMPGTGYLTKSSHSHGRSSSKSSELKLDTRIMELINGSVMARGSRYKSYHFDPVEDEVRGYVAPFSRQALSAILSLPAVQEHVASRMFGKRPVYIVSAVRVTTGPLNVAEGITEQIQANLSVSGSTTVTGAPAYASATAGSTDGRASFESYTTGAGVVFAYQLHVIKQRQGVAQAGLYSSKAAFMCDGDDVEDIDLDDFEIIEATEEEIVDNVDIDLENFHKEDMGNGIYCVSFSS